MNGNENNSEQVNGYEANHQYRPEGYMQGYNPNGQYPPYQGGGYQQGYDPNGQYPPYQQGYYQYGPYQNPYQNMQGYGNNYQNPWQSTQGCGNNYQSHWQNPPGYQNLKKDCAASPYYSQEYLEAHDPDFGPPVKEVSFMQLLFDMMWKQIPKMKELIREIYAGGKALHGVLCLLFSYVFQLIVAVVAMDLSSEEARTIAVGLLVYNLGFAVLDLLVYLFGVKVIFKNPKATGNAIVAMVGSYNMMFGEISIITTILGGVARYLGFLGTIYFLWYFEESFFFSSSKESKKDTNIAWVLASIPCVIRIGFNLFLSVTS